MPNPKVYFYSDDEVGVPWPGPDYDRPESFKEPRFVWYDWGWEETNNPDEATAFVTRQRLIWLTDAQIYNLPYLAGCEKRHIFFDLGSDGSRLCFRDFKNLPSIFFRACMTQELMAANPTAISWPWPVEDLSVEAESLGIGRKNYKYDIVFKGQITNDMAQRAVDSVAKSNLKSLIDVTPQFFAYMSEESKKKNRLEFLEVMKQGRLHLVPTSVPDGAIRYRLYEGMSLGRVGVHLCDECVLPLSDRIDWNYAIVTIPEADADNVGPILEEWFSRNSDSQIQERGWYARQVWRAWLDRARWNDVIGGEVSARLGRL